ncbi:MAG: nuclear transport factor 2 family protein [Alphaproteobacteria bacterium]|nr:nuclear transport factor 2 family protein [Alphaproteobacteria bacterium]
MISAVDLARNYFDLSNKGDLDGIQNLMTDQTTYSSQNTGVFLGVSQIMDMQRKFFSTYSDLYWDIKSISEERLGVVKIDFELSGRAQDGALLFRSGVEYVIVFNGKLQHLEIRNS